MVLFGTRVCDLRHFDVSAVIPANLNPKVVRDHLGHGTMADTTNTRMRR
jgi:hypothetical protein